MCHSPAGYLYPSSLDQTICSSAIFSMAALLESSKKGRGEAFLSLIMTFSIPLLPLGFYYLQLSIPDRAIILSQLLSWKVSISQWLPPHLLEVKSIEFRRSIAWHSQKYLWFYTFFPCLLADSRLFTYLVAFRITGVLFHFSRGNALSHILNMGRAYWMSVTYLTLRWGLSFVNCL